VKFAGKYIKPLKFLGLEFDGEMLSANTRKGSKLKLTKHMELIFETYDQRKQLEKLDVNSALAYLQERQESTNYLGTN